MAAAPGESALSAGLLPPDELEGPTPRPPPSAGVAPDLSDGRPPEVPVPRAGGRGGGRAGVELELGVGVGVEVDTGSGARHSIAFESSPYPGVKLRKFGVLLLVLDDESE